MHVIALALLALTGCGTPAPGPSASPDAPRVRKLTLAAYTTPREAYGREILPAFQKHWREKTGEEVTFEESYQGSGAQARAVIEGFEADVVALSLDPDVANIEKAGLITHPWRAAPNGGIVTRSIAVIGVRPGNPKQIKDWTDLGRADVEVLTPNVRTSGGAMWNVLAIWGAGIRGKTGFAPNDLPATEGLLASVLARVSVMDKGAREAMVNFEKGVGDATITYENEVLVARKEGKAIEYVVPTSTISIDNPVAVVDAYATRHGNQDIAEAFVTFLFTPEAQAAFQKYGLRPGDPAAKVDLPPPTDLFTISDLGGWDGVKTQIFAENAAYDRALAAARGRTP